MAKSGVDRSFRAVMQARLQNLRDDWLVGGDRDQFLHLTTQMQEQLAAAQMQESSTAASPLRVLLADSNPAQFLARLLAALTTHHCHLFLGNSAWSPAEWQSALTQVQPHLIWGDSRVQELGETLAVHTSGLAPKLLKDSGANALPPELLMIPTGGSSGQMRFVMHHGTTLMAAIQGFQAYFQVSTVNSFCVLPLYHVSGLMQVLRSLLSGGQLVVLPFKDWVEATGDGHWGPIDPANFFLSLVPTQLQRLLQHPERARQLASFHTIFLGGAPAWPELLATARHLRLPLAPTYGMTETAAQIATLKPQDFLQGVPGSGQMLPHAQISIRPSADQRAHTLQPGILTIQSSAIALGYYPQVFASRDFDTDDLGFVDAQGYLHIVGRASEKIITGGENVYPAEVEAAIRATGLVQDVCVVGVGDRHWGEAVTAVYVPTNSNISHTALTTALATALSKFKHPKHWIAVEQLPRNAQGKLNQVEMATWSAQIIRDRALTKLANPPEL